MTRKAFFAVLYDTTKFHHQYWILLYIVSFLAPFLYIYLLSINMPGPHFSWLLDTVTTIIGGFSIMMTFRAILLMFWTAINTHTLTNEKIIRLILTYLFILFSFAGIYLVAYFHSEMYLVQQEATSLLGLSPATMADKSLALVGVDYRFWSTAGLTIQWSNMPFIYLDMVYFSTSTLTTLGFGDIVAKLPFVKFLVILEALFGNLLLVMGVASVVPRQDG